MKNRMMYAIILFCVALPLIMSTAQAQNRRVGIAAAPELLIPVGARDIARGGAAIANTEGTEAIFWNPAGLGRLSHGAEAMFSHMSYIADIGVTYGAVAGRFGEFGVIGLSVKSLQVGDIPLTTQADPEGEGGRLYTPTYFTLGLSFARHLTDAISAGVSVKLVSENIDRVAANGVALDVGVQYHGLVGVQGLQLGVVVKNIGPQMQFNGSGLLRPAIAEGGLRPTQPYQSVAASFDLPSTLEIGLGYEANVDENLKWNVNGSFINNNLYLDQYNLGGEVGYQAGSVWLFGRAGYGIIPQAEEDEAIYGATYGAGITYNAPGIGVTVDYAYRTLKLFDANHVFTMKLGF